MVIFFLKKVCIQIGFGVTTPAKLNFRKLLLQYVEYCENQNLMPKLTQKHISGAGYPVTGPLKHFVKDRVMLLGDAVGFVNPLNGEGIHYAMFSGDIASEIIMQALVKNDFSEEFLQQYQDTCMKEFGNYLSKCGEIARK